MNKELSTFEGIARIKNFTDKKVLSSVSGYPLCRKEEKERLGSFCEWFGAQHRRPAFEVSLRGQESAPLEDFNFLYNRFEEMLTLGAIM